MKIAIVDDSRSDRSESITFLKSYLQKNLPKDFFPLVLKGFSGAEDFLASYKPGSYQLIFLDIFMPCLNGMEVAKIIRKSRDSCKIVFLTVSGDMALEGYTVFASGYLIKPLSGQVKELRKILTHILPMIKADRKQLSVRTNRTLIAFPFSKIVYIECYGSHFATLHVWEGGVKRTADVGNGEGAGTLGLTAVKTQTTFNECFRELSSDSRFLECYHKLCVNMEYIASMQDDHFVLENGLLLPISRRKKAEVKMRYLTYLSKQ